jgi:serine/threonine-protein kinase
VRRGEVCGRTGQLLSHYPRRESGFLPRAEEAWVSSEFSAQQYAAMARLVPGSQLAGYVIEEQIGAGGMAVVFRARDQVLGRPAALKVLSPTLAADQGFRVRFLRESQAVASVEEPHIIPVYGAGEVDGVLYIATKFVSGGDLAGVLQRAGGALEPARVAAFIEQVAAALDAAHAAGLVHRDVKPGNVLVDVVPGRGEHAYLSDFGLSKPAMAATGLTATGTFLGTPDYAPPEQIRAQPVDGRGDQYSLAVMAFALLSGNLPFHRQETMATLFAHLNDPVPPLSQFRGDLPPGADTVLARGLAKEARDRYARCGEFAAALRSALSGGGRAGAGAGSGSLPGAAQTRLESAPPGSRPPHGPQTAVWPPTKEYSDAPGRARPETELASPSVPHAPVGGAPSPLAPSWPWPAADAPAAAAAALGEQPTWTTQPPGGPSTPTPPFPAAGPTPPGMGAPPAGAVSGYAPRAAAPASQPPYSSPATPRPGAARPATSLPPPPPPAAGQGGKLPLVSKSAVIAVLAALAALLILYLLHGLG